MVAMILPVHVGDAAHQHRIVGRAVGIDAAKEGLAVQHQVAVARQVAAPLAQDATAGCALAFGARMRGHRALHDLVAIGRESDRRPCAPDSADWLCGPEWVWPIWVISWSSRMPDFSRMALRISQLMGDVVPPAQVEAEQIELHLRVAAAEEQAGASPAGDECLRRRHAGRCPRSGHRYRAAA